jgi:hypothetical protein
MFIQNTTITNHTKIETNDNYVTSEVVIAVYINSEIFILK